MAIQNGTVIAGATPTVTGGTSKTLTLTSQKVNNGINVKDMSVADARYRPSWSFSSTASNYDAKTGLWSKATKSVSLTVPYPVTVSGSLIVQFPVIRCELRDLPDMTVAQQQELLNYMSQCLFDTDFQQFWLNGAIS